MQKEKQIFFLKKKAGRKKQTYFPTFFRKIFFYQKKIFYICTYDGSLDLFSFHGLWINLDDGYFKLLRYIIIYYIKEKKERKDSHL